MVSSSASASSPRVAGMAVSAALVAVWFSSTKAVSPGSRLSESDRFDAASSIGRSSTVTLTTWRRSSGPAGNISIEAQPPM